MRDKKAIALFSGGLDSIIAVKWMQSRGFTVFPVFFKAPYLKAERAIDSARHNNLKLEVIDVSAEHKELLYNPVYGFGKRMNPCIDCHGFMFRKAAELLIEFQADFIISGEVLGQRPMSQRRDALDSVSKLSGVKDLIVRPLSQLLLSPTKPVREGWVVPDDLLALHGRGRQAQLELAQKLNIIHFPSPAGGCLLTDRNYCLRLKDLMDRGEESLVNLELLAYGRHFRLSETIKLIVGRTEADNNSMEQYFSTGLRFQAKQIMGPLGLLIGENPSPEILNLALGIFLAYHPKAEHSDAVVVQSYRDGIKQDKESEQMVSKADKNTCKHYQLSYS